MEHIEILGVRVTPATIDELHQGIDDLLKQPKQSFLISGNIHGLNQAYKYSWLKDFYNKADIVRVDGAGIVWAARILGRAIPPRLTWADWGWPLAKHLSQKQYRVFFLGGPIGIAQKAAENLQKNCGPLQLVGIQHGYFKKNGAENDAVIEMLNAAKPDVVIIGFGMPLQERWLIDNAHRTNVKLYLTCGAAFEYLAGTVSRCPTWMGKLGFEWLYRLLIEPKRMAKRYIYGNTIFMARVLYSRFIVGTKIGRTTHA